MKSSTRRDACARGNCTKGGNAGAGSACPVHRRRLLHLGMGQFSLLPPPFGASPSRLDRQGLAASTGATPAQPAGAGRLDRREDGPTGKPRFNRQARAGRTFPSPARPAWGGRSNLGPEGSTGTGSQVGPAPGRLRRDWPSPPARTLPRPGRRQPHPRKRHTATVVVHRARHKPH